MLKIGGSSSISAHDRLLRCRQASSILSRDDRQRLTEENRFILDQQQFILEWPGRNDCGREYRAVRTAATPGTFSAGETSSRLILPCANGLGTMPASNSPASGSMSSMNMDSPVTCVTAESCGMSFPTMLVMANPFRAAPH